MDKYFKLIDKVKVVTKDINCDCGAWCTSRPNYHSEWCNCNKIYSWKELFAMSEEKIAQEMARIIKMYKP